MSAQLPRDRPLKDHHGLWRHAQRHRRPAAAAAPGDADGCPGPHCPRPPARRIAGPNRLTMVDLGPSHLRAASRPRRHRPPPPCRRSDATGDGVLMLWGTFFTCPDYVGTLTTCPISAAAARSISSSVVNRPTLRRTAPWPSSGGT